MSGEIVLEERPADDAPTREALLALSAAWEAEDSCRGYAKNDEADVVGRRIFAALVGGEMIGYLFGKACRAEQNSSVMQKDEEYFELEEIYVAPDMRSKGVGRALFRRAEETLRTEDVRTICLSTATKNYRAILHFYIEEMDMEFWSARLFKRI